MQVGGIGTQYNYKTYSRSLNTNRTSGPQGQQRSFTDTLEINNRAPRNPIAMLQNAPQDIQEAWKKAEEEAGGNPFFDDEGKLLPSITRMIEMEYRLAQKYGPQTACTMMDNIMSDKSLLYELMNMVSEKLKDPRYAGLANRSPDDVAKELKFIEKFLSYTNE